jgi:nitrite reductase/ring-hydroxylating ferredoxin subunit
MEQKVGEGFIKIAKAKDFRVGKAFKFNIKRSDRVTEAFAFKKEDAYYGYLNLCRHWSVGLDYDDNEFFSRNGELLVCKNHGAIYDPKTGACRGGPGGGASLYKVPLVEIEGIVYADTKNVDWGEMG